MAGWVQAIGAIYSIYSGEQQRSDAKKSQKRQLEAMKKNSALDMNDAAQEQAARDRKRKRRGVLANIYAGEDAEEPKVRRKKLFAQPQETLG